jgi:spore germination cell wall hydrolase CwlJ-like protein
MKGGQRRKVGKRKAAQRDMLPAIILLSAFAAAVLLVWLIARSGRIAVPPPSPEKLSMAQARAINASIPFIGGPLARARPFRFKGTPAAREQATQCLATAALYEAGSDPRGQKAVIQVVLNRLALPQYPKTVCGVVYQGAARPTGCQFSFTCDGSVTRRPEHEGWPQARIAAQRALSGYVFGPVGTATHYHADWMVPYWMPTLSKIAQIHSHIFYRPHHAGDEPANGAATASP